MTQFQENTRKDGRRTEGRTARPYFMGPFRLPPESNKGFLQALASPKKQEPTKFE